MLHVDLLVLVGGFGVSHFFFNKGEIGTSVPLVYPVLAYFLVRMLVAAFRPRRTGEPLVPLRARRRPGCGNRAARRLPHRARPRRGQGRRRRLRQRDRRHQDPGATSRSTWTAARTTSTSTPTGRSTTSPTTRSCGSGSRRSRRSMPPTTTSCPPPGSRRSCSTRSRCSGCSCSGMRLRRGRAGRLLGLALAYGWVSFPYTLFPLMTNSNDTLISMLRRVCAAGPDLGARARSDDRARRRGEVRAAGARAAVRHRARRGFAPALVDLVRDGRLRSSAC